jgi:predicted DNA-binding transcriptional regulator YafY
VSHARSAAVMKGAAGQVTAEPERRPDPDHPGDDIVSLMYRNAQHAQWSLLGYCAEHEVVGPPEVREGLAESARAILARYG